MGRFGKYIKYRISKFKDELKIHLVYTKKFPHSKVLSIMPGALEPEIKTGVIIQKDVTISDELKSIGQYTYIGWGTEITRCSFIGAFTSISNDVKIGLTNHALDHIGTSPIFYAKRRGWVKEDTYKEDGGELCEIGNDVLISANVIILKGVKIGTGAVIGAGAMVNKDVPPYAIVAGVPARILKYRFDNDTIAKLLDSKWWEMSKEELQKRNHNFNNVEVFLEHL